MGSSTEKHLKLDEIFQRHEQRIDILETLEFGLINTIDQHLIFRRKSDWFSSEAWIKML